MVSTEWLTIILQNQAGSQTMQNLAGCDKGIRIFPKQWKVIRRFLQGSGMIWRLFGERIAIPKVRAGSPVRQLLKSSRWEMTAARAGRIKYIPSPDLCSIDMFVGVGLLLILKKYWFIPVVLLMFCLFYRSPFLSLHIQPEEMNSHQFGCETRWYSPFIPDKLFLLV